MRRVALAQAGSGGEMSEVERLRQSIPENSWDAEFMKVTGLDIQMITNSLKLISHKFGVSAKSMVENVDGELIMVVDIPTPSDREQEFEEKLKETLRALKSYFPTVSPHLAIWLNNIND